MKKALILLISLFLVLSSLISCGKLLNRNIASDESHVTVESKEIEEEEEVPEAIPNETYESMDSGTSADDSQLSEHQNPFYGVWCYASTVLSEAQSFVASNPSFEIIVTSEWSNLNSETYYAVTTGRYSSENEAINVLESVKESFPDAYVKYSGTKKTTNTEIPLEEHEVDWTCGHIGKSFYGVWCQADKSYDRICESAEYMRSLGFDARVLRTWDWSNLNPDKYYAITIGEHETLEEANKILAQVKSVYPDAYVKYTGTLK